MKLRKRLISHIHVAARMWNFPGKRNAKRLRVAQGVSVVSAGRVPAACHSDSHTSIFCVWVVQLQLICDSFPLYFKSGLECTTKSFGSALAWITSLRIQKRMDVGSEATAEERMLAQRAEKIRVPVEAIALIV